MQRFRIDSVRWNMIETYPVTDSHGVTRTILMRWIHKPAPLPETSWPPYIASVAAQRQPGEAGAGDTVARVIGEFGSEPWRLWYAEATGPLTPQCQCQMWRAKWNALYSYKPTNNSLPVSGTPK